MFMWIVYQNQHLNSRLRINLLKKKLLWEPIMLTATSWTIKISSMLLNYWLVLFFVYFKRELPFLVSLVSTNNQKDHQDIRPVYFSFDIRTVFFLTLFKSGFFNINSKWKIQDFFKSNNLIIYKLNLS